MSSHTSKHTPRLVAGCVVVYVLLVAPLILIPRFDERGRGAYDQMNYHQRVVETFAAELPSPDLTDYLSATTPGYHLVLAIPSRAGVGTRGLRLLGLAFGAALVGVVAGFVGSRAPPLQASALPLPLAASMYVVHSGIWLLPDNAAWLGVAVVLAISFRARLDVWFLVGGGLALAYLVMMRQIHMWAATPLWAAAWFGTGEGERSVAWLFKELPDRIRRAAAAFGATLPAFAVFGAFAMVWGGLTPPTFQDRYGAANPATPAFILALIGIYSTFFAGFLLPSLFDLVKRHGVMLACAIAAGAVVAMAPETSFDQDAGRWTGLWRIIDKTPVIADRSPLLIVLAIGGAVALAAWWHAMRARPRFIAFLALAGFTAAQTASHELWQRYNEPFLLMLLSMMAVQLCEAGEGQTIRRLRTAGPAALGAMIGLVTLVSLVTTWREDPRRLVPLDELQDVIDRTVTLEEGTTP